MASLQRSLGTVPKHAPSEIRSFVLLGVLRWGCLPEDVRHLPRPEVGVDRAPHALRFVRRAFRLAKALFERLLLHESRLHDRTIEPAFLVSVGQVVRDQEIVRLEAVRGHAAGGRREHRDEPILPPAR